MGKRELSVITGIASQESVGWSGPPLSATAPPMTRPLPIHAAEHQQLGTRDTRHQQVGSAEEGGRRDQEQRRPPSEPRPRSDQRERQDPERALPDGSHALLHVEHAFPIEVIPAQPRAGRRRRFPGMRASTRHQTNVRLRRYARLPSSGRVGQTLAGRPDELRRAPANARGGVHRHRQGPQLAPTCAGLTGPRRPSHRRARPGVGRCVAGDLRGRRCTGLGRVRLVRDGARHHCRPQQSGECHF